MNSLTGLKFSGRKQTKQSEIKKFKLRGLTSKVILAISMSVLGSGASLVALSGVASATSLSLGGLTYSLSGTAPYVATVTGQTGNAATVTIPSTITSGGTTYSVTSLGYGAFANDTTLASITLPNSITSISNNVFYDDTSLASITIPSSVTSIGILAFYANTALTSITIPNSVTSIGSGAFYGDTNLTFIDSSGFVATWSGIGGPYTTAQLITATNNEAVTGTWASVVRVAPIIYSKPTAPYLSIWS